MKRSFRFFLIIYLIIISATLYIYFHSASLLSPSNGTIFPINNFQTASGIDDLKYRVFDQEAPGEYLFTAIVTGSDILKVTENIPCVVINRVVAGWYKVYFNGRLVGHLGNLTNERANLWNNVAVYPIEKNHILDTNTLTLKLFTRYEMGGASTPVFFTDIYHGETIKTWFERILIHAALVTQGIIAFGSILFIMLTLVRPGSAKYEYMLIAFSIFLMGIYLFDYVPFSSLPFHSDILWKTTITSLYLSVFFINIAFYLHFRHKISLLTGLAVLSGLIILHLFFSGSMPVFKKSVAFMNTLLSVSLITWVYISLRFIKNSLYAHSFFVASAILFACTSFDIYYLIIQKYPPVRLTIYGTIAFSISLMLLVALEYVDTLEILATESRRADTHYNASIRDSMTGLYNHGHMLGIIDKINEPFAFIIIDIDDFKEINDSYGHPAGDRVIKFVADRIQGAVRKSDIASRYGGDEFTVALPGCNELYAQKIALKIQKCISEFSDSEFDSDFKFSISIGIAETSDMDSRSEDIVTRADKALYHAKKDGKGRVSVYSDVKKRK